MAFSYILLFFKNNKDIKLVAARIKFFELFNNYHPLDYKFYKTRIVNLTNEYNCIYISASSTIFKASIIKANKFPENISFYEDVRLLNSILLVKPIMGLIREVIYYYRKRADFSLNSQNHNKEIDFYLYTIKNVHQYLLDSSKMQYNIALPFIQFIIGYDVLFIIPSYAYKYLDRNNFNKYSNMIESLLNQIDDKYILEQKILNYKVKIFVFSKKYHKDLRYDVILENNFCLYSYHILIDFNKNKDFLIWIIFGCLGKNTSIFVKKEINHFNLHIMIIRDMILEICFALRKRKNCYF